MAIRFLAWIILSATVSFAVAPEFLSLLDQALNENFGTVFPAVPFAALLFVLFALRGNDLLKILDKETGLKSDFVIRLLGVMIVTSLIVLRGLTSETVESAGVAIILAVYSSSLIINPLTKGLMLPYALIYIGGVTAPSIIQLSLGQPLATLSAFLSEGAVGLSGMPVAWQGTQFSIASETGDYIAATVTPGCSSVISITTFLGLLALMHLDLRKKVSSTFKFAFFGALALFSLNSLRIFILIWIGYTGGSLEFWSFHNWVGYAVFLGFYLVIMPLYARTSGNQNTRITISWNRKFQPSQI